MADDALEGLAYRGWMTRPLLARLPPETRVDALFALAVAAAEIIATEIVLRAAGSETRLDLAGYALLVASAAPLALRNRYPTGVLLAVVMASVVYTWLGYPGGFYTTATVIAIWTAVAAGRRVAGVVAGVTLVGAVLAATLAGASGHARDPDASAWLGGWLVASFVLGEVSRGRRQSLEQVEQRAIDAERTREEEARRRAGEERLRIARELHDVLAHNISMINVQAGVAVHLLDRQPEQARTALVAISKASKEALRELRATLGVLRQVDEAEPRGPTPGLARLSELVAGASGGGLEVAVDTTGEPRPLPPSTDLAAYRIVQESLTNVARHSAAKRATVSIRYGMRDVVIEVDDDGRGAPAEAILDGGNGLLGMRERAAAVGGELEVGSRVEGGFRVRARLPAEAGS